MLAAIQFGDRNGQMALQEIAGSRLINLRQVQMTDFTVFCADDFPTISCLQHSMQMVQQGSLRKIFALKLAPECCCFEKFAIFPYGTRNYAARLFFRRTHRQPHRKSYRHQGPFYLCYNLT